MNGRQVNEMNNADSRGGRLYFAVSMLLMLLINRIIFPLGHLLSWGAPHRDLSLPIDAKIPFLPWMIAVYIGVFAWWVYVSWLIADHDRQKADRFFLAQLLIDFICLLFFVFFPTSIVRPELNGQSIWVVFLKLLYEFDTPDNLFPSIHCALGWLCWIGIRGNKEYSSAIRSVSFVMAVAVCFATIAIRQHVLADVFAGILLSEICWLLADIPALRGLYSGFIDHLMQRINKTSERNGAI